MNTDNKPDFTFDREKFVGTALKIFGDPTIKLVHGDGTEVTDIDKVLYGVLLMYSSSSDDLPIYDKISKLYVLDKNGDIDDSLSRDLQEHVVKPVLYMVQNYAAPISRQIENVQKELGQQFGDYAYNNSKYDKEKKEFRASPAYHPDATVGYIKSFKNEETQFYVARGIMNNRYNDETTIKTLSKYSPKLYKLLMKHKYSAEIQKYQNQVRQLDLKLYHDGNRSDVLFDLTESLRNLDNSLYDAYNNIIEDMSIDMHEIMRIFNAADPVKKANEVIKDYVDGRRDLKVYDKPTMNLFEKLLEQDYCNLPTLRKQAKMIFAKRKMEATPTKQEKTKQTGWVDKKGMIHKTKDDR